MKETESEKRKAGESERHHLSLLGSSNQQETRTTLDNYSRQEHHDQLDESGTIHVKRARLGATSAATTVVAAVSVAENLPEPESWWDRCNSTDFPEEDFRAAFHMGRATFNKICDELRSFAAKDDTSLLGIFPVEQGVAACIWRLVTGDSFRLVSDKFGLGFGLETTPCRQLVIEVCSAVKTVLKPKFLKWPRETDYISSVKSKFESISGIQNVVGSIYTTHFPITAPPIDFGRDKYRNEWHTGRNGYLTYTVTLQGVVDSYGAFTDVSIGLPGSMSDDQVLEKSELYGEGEAGKMTGTWVVGGNSYPLMDWLLVPYRHQNLTPTQQAFNEKIGDVRSISKRAFTRLKSRWGCLRKRIDVNIQDLPVVLEACCVLHNICENEGDEMGPVIWYELIDNGTLSKDPVKSLAAVKQRDSIAYNLLH